MKKLFITTVIIFWIIIGSLLTVELVSNKISPIKEKTNKEVQEPLVNKQISNVINKKEKLFIPDGSFSTPSDSAKFLIGTKIKTIAKVRVRQDPTTLGKFIAMEKDGAKGVIIDNPERADNYWWYYIEYKSGVKGWSVQDFLIQDLSKVINTPPPSQDIRKCTSWSYGDWDACTTLGIQSRSVLASSPDGCLGGVPVTFQPCIYLSPPPTPKKIGLTYADVATHNNANNCWLIISDKVYDVTQYILYHPGGQSLIINSCGADATMLFTSNMGSGYNHSGGANNLLSNYYIDNLNTAP